MSEYATQKCEYSIRQGSSEYHDINTVKKNSLKLLAHRLFLSIQHPFSVPLLLHIGLPDLPYFTGDPVFQTLSPASRGEAAGKNKCPVFR